MSKLLYSTTVLSSYKNSRRKRLKQLLRDIWEAISGTEQDFTTGKLGGQSSCFLSQWYWR